jgi:hypothetical protein
MGSYFQRGDTDGTQCTRLNAKSESINNGIKTTDLDKSSKSKTSKKNKKIS